MRLGSPPKAGGRASGPGRGSAPWGLGARTGLALAPAPAEGSAPRRALPASSPGGGGGAGEGAGGGRLSPPTALPPHTLLGREQVLLFCHSAQCRMTPATPSPWRQLPELQARSRGEVTGAGMSVERPGAMQRQKGGIKIN